MGNFDRHMGNWGYLVSRTGPVRPSPIYDNGSTLFPALSEYAMKTDILPNRKEILKRTLLFPKAALIIHGQKVSYYDMFCSDFEPQITKAVLDIVPVIKERLPEINRFIDEQEFLSDVRKTFYKTMLAARYYFLLEPAWEICAERKFSRSAGERLEKGISYTEEAFERDYQGIQNSERWKIRNGKWRL